jgi:DNA-binding CsgD family transcriptional regulator
MKTTALECAGSAHGVGKRSERAEDAGPGTQSRHCRPVSAAMATGGGTVTRTEGNVQLATNCVCSVRGSRVSARPLGSTSLTEPAWQAVASSLDLTPRELHITMGAFDDNTEAAIAGHLAISTHTVHEHFRRLFVKLGVRTRAGLVLRVWSELVCLILSSGSVLPPLCPRWAAGRCVCNGQPNVAPGAEHRAPQ